MPRPHKRPGKTAKKVAPAAPRAGVTPLTAAAIAKQLKLKSVRQAEDWCAENGIPAFTRDEWKSAYGADPGGSHTARYYHPGMVTALIEDQLIEEDRARELADSGTAPPPFDDDSDNY